MALSFNIGTSMAMKVSGSANSSGHDSGMVAPRKMPSAVLTCQVSHSEAPAPRKNHWPVGVTP